MNELSLVTEIEFQEFMKDKTFNINNIRNATQFFVKGDIIAIAFFDNETPKNSKFYLLKE